MSKKQTLSAKAFLFRGLLLTKC